MEGRALEFCTGVFSVEVDRLAAHSNPVPNVLIGRGRPVTVESMSERISGDVLFIQPGVQHQVSCGPDGFDVIYLDGLQRPDLEHFARSLCTEEAWIAIDVILQKPGAARELRDRLGATVDALPSRLSSIIADLIADPMVRMSQVELADRLQLERTTALRAFKAATGQTFRRFKQWSALQHATRQIATGELVRTAALDAGFADTAHLSRTFRASFGLSPAEAVAGRGKAAPSF